MKNSSELSILFDFFKKKKFLVLFTFTIFLINAVVSILSPVYLGKMIDVVKLKKGLNFDLILKNGRELIIFLIILIVVQVLSGFLLAYLKKESGIHYQKLIFTKMLYLPYLQLIKFRTAYLQSRWGKDSMNLSSFYSENLFELIKNFFIIIFGVIIAFWLSARFSFFIIMFMIIVSSSIFLSSKYLVKHLRMYLEDFSLLSGKVNEAISGIIELKIMGFINKFRSMIFNDIKSTVEKYYSIQLKALLILSFTNLLMFAAFLGILLYFGYLLTSNKISIGNAIGYLAVTFFVVKSMIGLVNGVNRINTTLASLKRTAELFKATSGGLEFVHDKTSSHLKSINKIELKNIFFKYAKQREDILKDFSFKFDSGKVYVLKGVSGSGKSTLIKILLGIIPLEEGEILVNGEQLHKSDLHSFWKKISYLAQDPFLFKGNLLENLIPKGKKDFDKNKFIKAIGDSGINVNEFPETMEIEEGGKNISGGEKRRIALARSFFKEPDVLILDEPTSQVDKTNEEIITNSLISFARRGKIVIIIAHSPLTIKKADIVIDMSRYSSFRGN